MRFSIVCCCLLLQGACAYAQLQEHFNDSSIISSHGTDTAWHGTDSAWQVKNGLLQSHYRQASSSFYVTTPSFVASNASWEWWMRLDFNTSSLNYVDVYLTADTSNLLSATVKGYFVRIGNTKDEVCLYRKAAASVLMIDGRDGITDHSSNTLKIKVVCNEDHEWSLWVNDVLEGSIKDSVLRDSRYMGFAVKQSTASFFEKHFFDDVIVAPLGPLVNDTLPPADPPAVSPDVVINEVLYDGSPEFIELYNRGEKAADLSTLFLARGHVAFSNILLPGEYAAFTTDPLALCMRYNCKVPGNIYKMNLPALINKEGDIILLRSSGDTLDAFHYSDDMQFALSDNINGVSLERLDVHMPTQDPHNWHSAAATAGYATPGSVNSQLLQIPALPGELTITPEIFSPDNDGTNDVAVLSYILPAPGYVANITVYDAGGRPVRYLQKSTLLGLKGQMIWDGLGESKKLLPTGIYIVFIEMFDLKGQVKRWKLPVVLAKGHN